MSFHEKIEQYNNKLNDLKNKIMSLPKDEFNRQFLISIKTDKFNDSYSYDNNNTSQMYNTNVNLFSNNKNRNNVVYINNNPSTPSTPSNSSNISYGPTVF